MTEQDELHMLAVASDPDWAITIRKRNQALLTRLTWLKRYAEKTVPEEIRPLIEDPVPLGCPHCISAAKLAQIWQTSCVCCQYYQILGHGCMGTLFNNEYLKTVPLVRYFRDSARILLPCENCILRTEELQRAIAFVQAHIEWTNDPDWGKEA